MLAFVLSGGGNRGPLEVGALQVLLEHSILPGMLVGTSAGAINAAFLADDPTPETAQRLGALWIKARDEDVFSQNRLGILWRFMTGKDSLYSNDKFLGLVAKNLPQGLKRFGDIHGAKLYIVATVLETGEPHVFGRDPEENVVDAIMASTALPPFFPPWRCGDELLVDGGMAADLPVSIAVAQGATEVYALHLVDAPPRVAQLHGVLNIAEQAINTVLAREQRAELEESESTKEVTIHYVPLTGFYGIPLSDLSQTEQMIESGREQMEEYLQTSGRVLRNERFSSLRKAWRHGVNKALKGLSRLTPSH
jgi:NTE family protein